MSRKLEYRHIGNRSRFSHRLSLPVMSFAACSLLFLLPCAFWKSTACAETISVMADGVAVLRDGAVPEARHAAIVDAVKEAVRQVMGQMVESTTLVENAQLVTDRIQTKTSGYVTGYRVLRERQDPGLYRVTVEAAVDRTQLGQDLEAIGLLYRRVGNPRFLVLVNDSFAGTVLPDFITETEISRLLIARGFQVVDQARLSSIRQGEPARQLIQGNSKGAQVLGQQLGADVLIVGEANGGVAMRGGPLGGMVSARSHLQAKAVRADTGEVLCSETASAPAVDISEVVAGRKSFVGVAGRWLEAALPSLLARWTRESEEENVILLTIGGLAFEQVDQFMHLLTTRVIGITSVRSRGFSEKIATVEVIGMVTGEALGRALSRSDLQPFKIDVNSVSVHRIGAQIRAH